MALLLGRNVKSLESEVGDIYAHTVCSSIVIHIHTHTAYSLHVIHIHTLTVHSYT